MKRYFVYRGRKLVGGVTITAHTAGKLRTKGYRLLPA